jgi:predicted transcriptional regulator
MTQQAAASMDAGSMTVPEIARLLVITERQIRNPLKPVPVSGGGERTRDYVD